LNIFEKSKYIKNDILIINRKIKIGVIFEPSLRLAWPPLKSLGGGRATPTFILGVVESPRIKRGWLENRSGWLLFYFIIFLFYFFFYYYIIFLSWVKNRFDKIRVKIFKFKKPNQTCFYDEISFFKEYVLKKVFLPN
jgi:hypothetical protein